MQRREGKSLILSFKAAECGIDLAEFAPKLLGKNKKGKMIYAYVRAPWIQNRPAILSALKPELQGSGKDSKVSIDVGNFGQSKSSAATLFLYKKAQGNLVLLSKVDVQPLNSFEHTKVQLPVANVNELLSGDFRIVISAAGNVENEFNFSLKPTAT